MSCCNLTSIGAIFLGFSTALAHADSSLQVRYDWISVKNAISTNRHLLGDILLVVDRILEDSTVKEEKTVSGGDAKTGRWQIHLSPRVAYAEQVVYSGGRCWSGPEGASVPENGLLFDSGRWWTRDSSRKTITIRRSDQMPGFESRDPLEVFTPSLRSSLEETLEAGELISLKTSDDGGLVHAALRINGDQQFFIDFDLTRGLLPVAAKHCGPDGRAVYEVTATYRELQDGPGWMLDRAERILPSSTVVEQGAPSWRQRLTVTIREIRRPSAELVKTLFATSAPPGWSIVDLTQPRAQHSSKAPLGKTSPPESSRLRSLLLLMNLIAAGGVIGIWLTRRVLRRARTKA